MLVTSSRLTVCSLFKELECAQNARVPAQFGQEEEDTTTWGPRQGNLSCINAFFTPF